MKKILFSILSAGLILFSTSCNCDKKCNAPAEPVIIKKVIIAKVEIKSDMTEEFVDGTVDLIEKSREEEGCISYSLYGDTEDAAKYVFVEEWKDQAAIDFHFDTDHFKNFGKLLDNVGAGPADIKIFDVCAEK